MTRIDSLRMSSNPEKARTVIFSQRNFTKIQPFRCAHFEFEDVVSQTEDAIVLNPRIDNSSSRHVIAKRLGYHIPLGFSPGLEEVTLPADFELLLAICAGPSDLLQIHAIKNWRSRCRKAICLIDEVWIKQIASYRHYLHMLRQFDLVVLYYSQSVGPINELIGQKKCVFLPPGVDTLRFCPYPNPPKRVVDVYSIGRRSPLTHKAFLAMCAKNEMLYLYDSTSADQVLDPIEHRVLFANLSKRSRYFIVNPGLIDRPDVRGEQIEFGNRYFEAAASGSILLGERPRSDEFDKFFDWPDALIEMPYDSQDAEKIITALDAEPEHQSQIRRQNVKQTLLRHDWVYRWESMLRLVGENPSPKLEVRKRHLQLLAEKLEEQFTLEATTIGSGSHANDK